ncbi:MAG TPA: hypothetical protein VIN34_09045 [Candidatus Limnocylindria bacterium]|jgi:hypothetical protein
MFSKLIELLLQAKAGVISGVFLLGATGALISVSASNGVTTVTITEASPSPSAAASPSASASPTESPTATPTATVSPVPAVAATPDPAAAAACAAEAQAIALQVQRVNSAFSGFHTQLEKRHEDEDHGNGAVKASDQKLKEIRQAAVKAIHATRTCKDDEDKDEDEAKTTTDNDADKSKDENKDGDHQSTSGVTFTGTAESIATQAIAAMQVAFDAAPAAPAVTTTKKPEETRHAEGTKKPEAKNTAKPGEDHERD